LLESSTNNHRANIRQGLISKGWSFSLWLYDAITDRVRHLTFM